MTTATASRFSGITCTLLLPQLKQIWLPDQGAAHQEHSPSPWIVEDSKPQVPQLISFLEALSDAATSDNLPGKRLPCGHIVSLRSILACCNFFGDATWLWAQNKNHFGCGQPGCTDTVEVPQIPDPRVVDGLAARLHLVEWSWLKREPTEPDMATVSILRSTLSRIGHRCPETDTHVRRREPSESSLSLTLVHMEIEAFALMTDERAKGPEIAARGSQPYCSYRPPMVVPSSKAKHRYRIVSPGRECECVTPHDDDEREARDWALTPAETEPDDPLYSLTRGGEAGKRKSVRFVAPCAVTRVRYFEPWLRDAYCDRDGYWSMGLIGPEVEAPTAAGDVGEGEDGNEGGDEWYDEDEGSECDTLFDSDEEEEMEGAGLSAEEGEEEEEEEEEEGEEIVRDRDVIWESF